MINQIGGIARKRFQKENHPNTRNVAEDLLILRRNL